MTAQDNVLQPALDALASLRSDMRRIGKEGGNLNGKIKANLNTIGVALNQFATIISMTGTIAQQSQLIVKATNDIARLALPPGDDDNGDDGSSGTKGE